MKKLIRSLIAVGLVASALNANAQEKGWSFEVGPYAWLAGIDADVTAGGRKGSVDVGFNDLLDYVDLAGGLLVVADNGDWTVWAQGDFIALDSDNEATKFDEAGSLESDMTIIEAAVGRILDNPLKEGATIDVLLGLRYTDIENTFNPSSGGSSESGSDYIDPMLVLRPAFPLTESLTFNPTLAIGGGGDSDLIYELQPQLEYAFSDSAALRVGYRRVYYKVEGDRGEFDGSLHGAMVGLAFKL